MSKIPTHKMSQLQKGENRFNYTKRQNQPSTIQQKVKSFSSLQTSTSIQGHNSRKNIFILIKAKLPTIQSQRLLRKKILCSIILSLTKEQQFTIREINSF
ncbi:hypothetical protein TTHERM_000016048 (macronuclear) [Tetrahymena thermophila SB210]|uniref:Uncharacterized protein n=1 Tax=Tetrahymena thermophila (strain SB210) TaxID=312017 RepID=W7XKB6_TETTS|nr:hypothetical protein TTHERM_000016048 [Tetrahymena thermophila SB210]EWS76366.1 hypothetical protein TTHERM_000016048 [Tetrahymena thermophila SB210]|eukprot:XP_012651150.1 hypothetical protein TTHERM_000016048 [Tetrahymena thermophila SB210]